MYECLILWRKVFCDVYFLTIHEITFVWIVLCVNCKIVNAWNEKNYVLINFLEEEFQKNPTFAPVFLIRE